MAYYTQRGKIPQKRHTQFRKEDGSLYYEEVIGAEGFSGISSIAYHINPPTAIEKVGDAQDYSVAFAESKNMQHRHLKGAKLQAKGDWLSGRQYIMGNDDVKLAVCQPKESMNYFVRNAVADELIYVHEGEGELLSPLGSVKFTQGDYVHIPRTITHQWKTNIDKPSRFLVIESNSEVRFPKRYRNQFGQLLEHSPFCERDIKMPEYVEAVDEKGEFEVKILKHGQLHSFLYSFHPFDVVGWDGYMYPYAISIHDFEPITGRIHQPPPVHQMFEAHNFVVCSFVPRLFDYHPQSIPAPYSHSNIDSDEVLFYAEGDFMSRKGVERASFTLHPGGMPHGPHPGTAEASIGKKGTEELAVMVDTFRPLKLTQQALEIEDQAYIYSWKI
ncbi:homogentisate 1,2-dioxygenase [Porifericola rhodea]|uniref:homogentisate 1,2-dioxygenase n=1 Tax=Porifericola rhodea TaxID=930972 RepID=UPI0026650BBF|nr:cupin domain-containing protein [Porifericola rhodea]WKN33309.1 homogentisate 1,2-dioxygenase [Porifericola rhodea]